MISRPTPHPDDFGPAHTGEAAITLLEGRVRLLMAPLIGRPDDLFPEEWQHIARARHQRRLEFATGRVLARRLLRGMNLPPGPIPVGTNRAPQWPRGVVGSIAHCRDRCAVAVARVDDMPGLGIDIERNVPIEPELWATILTPEEFAWIGRRPSADRGRLVTLLFSAKESVYKCVHPYLHRMLEFSDVSIQMDPDRQEFGASLGSAVQTDGVEADRIRGWADCSGSWLITVAVLSPNRAAVALDKRRPGHGVKSDAAQNEPRDPAQGHDDVAG